MIDDDALTYRPRTRLAARIAEMNMTLEEFVQHAEQFAREHGEPGTLSLRHLQRLVAGHRGDGRPLGPIRPSTARLLERMLGASIRDLLVSQPAKIAHVDLGEMLAAARRVDSGLIRAFRDQLDRTRRLDRQRGAVATHSDVLGIIDDVEALAMHSVAPNIRIALDALLSEVLALAGWQALDMGRVAEAWRYYGRAEAAAAANGLEPYRAHAIAGKSVILTDLGEAREAVALSTLAVPLLRKSPPILRAWLAASRGEVFAAAGQSAACGAAFERARHELTAADSDRSGPYVAMSNVHLDRWHGHALAMLSDRQAAGLLSEALVSLDPSFVRASAAVHADLALTLSTQDHEEAMKHCKLAYAFATELDSHRHRRRLSVILKLRLLKARGHKEL